jgi:hypothetical protein
MATGQKRSKALGPNRAQRRAGKGSRRRVQIPPDQLEGRKNEQRGIGPDGRHLRAYIPPVRPRGSRPVHGPPLAVDLAASEYWIGEQFPYDTHTNDKGESVSFHFHAPNLVPSGQVRCRGCGHMTPPNVLTTSGHCPDCHYGSMSKDRLEMLPGSVSVAVLPGF